jgi:uncharacterized OB-fold protein
MTEPQKIQNIEEQMVGMRRGKLVDLRCPYCGQVNEPGETMCCATFALAFAAITERMEGQERIDDFRRIQDKASEN